MAVTVASTSHAARHLPGGGDALAWASQIHGMGTASARPAAASTNAGLFYVQTDGTTGVYRSDGSAWTLVATVGSSSPNATTSATGLVQLAGDLAGTATAPKVASVNGTTVPASSAANTYLKTSAAGTASWVAASAVDNGDGTVTITL